MKDRIRAIMAQNIGRKLSVAKKLILALACSAALVVPVVIGLLTAPTSLAQSRSAAKPSFDVVSIKQAKDCMHPPAFAIQPGRWVNTCISLESLIIQAYDIKPYQLSGGPNWIHSSRRFDIEAKSTDPTFPAQMKLMLQSLLEERFHLKMHREKREIPIYALVVAKGGQKLQRAKDEPGNPNGEPLRSGFVSVKPDPARPGPGQCFMFGPQYECKAGEISSLADILLPTELGRPVVDKTGITGLYDFSLKWTPDTAQSNLIGAANPAMADTLPPIDLSKPSIFTALQEQLGLRLEPDKGSVEFFVIDSAEQPSEN